MQVVTPDFIHNKKVILRLDLDVPLEKVTGYRLQVTEDFRLKAGLPTLKLCLEHASEVIIIGHIGRPQGQEVPELSVEPIYEWLAEHGFKDDLESGKLRLLENLRFEDGEDRADLEYAKELAALGEIFINEAFAAHHPAASTTILPTRLPHAAGLNFAREVAILTRIRENPRRPLVVIIGGVKVEDKLPAVLSLAKIADYVLVGGKIALQGEALQHCKASPCQNVLVAQLNEEGTDITPETIERWQEIIKEARVVVWNGPVGKVEDMGSERGTYELAHILADCEAETIVGGGDTVGFLGGLGVLNKFSFISTGGGAMLELLTTGTLPTIEVLG